QGPKSCRVQRYNPPAAGYFVASAATAPVSGAANKTVANSHSTTELEPECAAIGSQRVEIMIVTAKSVRSRRPSSRLRAGATAALVAEPKPVCLPATRSPYPLRLHSS